MALIFCVDTSGSMCTKAGRNKVTRTKCVTSAIKSSLIELKEKHPNRLPSFMIFSLRIFHRKVGIVTFNSEIYVQGDGFENPREIKSNLDFESYISMGKGLFKTHMQHTVNESFAKIFKSLDGIEESGSTALGPALCFAVGMASQAAQGGSIILCTDGLANRGLGSLMNESDEDNARQFYNKVADFANHHAVMINITTIKGDECKIDVLGSLTDSTDGKIVRVNPDDLENNFQNFLKEEILATKADIKLFLPKALTLRNSDLNEFKQVSENYYQKIMGNITERSELVFEYDLKPEEDESKLIFYSNEKKGFPLQTQISFETPAGSFLKIITVFQRISNEREEVEKRASIGIIKKTATLKTCNLAIKQK